MMKREVRKHVAASWHEGPGGWEPATATGCDAQPRVYLTCC